MSLPKLVAALLSLAAVAAPLHAGQQITDSKDSKKVVLDDFPYKAGVTEIELNVGGFGSIGTKGTPVRPDVGYAIGELRYGIMLSDIHGDGILRGNFEFLGEVFGGGIFSGPGDALVGADIFLRYNFVQPQSKIVPFIQVGGGGVYSDAAGDDPIQRNIGSDWSFVLEAEIGVRYHLSPRLAITTGVEYRHISNADTADRNQGLNSLGGVIGVSWFY
jgi:opacity protein-like surface antigen